jgi:site-specific DNA recombinase
LVFRLLFPKRFGQALFDADTESDGVRRIGGMFGTNGIINKKELMIETQEAGLRLAIYARVSTEEQREGQTINSQVAELERFADAKGWVMADVYKDAGWSGSIMARPELDRLRDDARGGRLQAVLINDVDRLARDVTHLGVIKRDLERHNVRVIFRKLSSETGPMSNLMVNILGSFAEFERELIIDRTRRGRRHKVEHQRQYLGSNTAYGYRYERMDRINGRAGRLDVEPHEAQVVRQMFEWVDAEHLSAGGVARRLNEECQRPRKSILWGKSSVLRILHNEMYAGVWHYNKFQCCEPQQHRVQVPYRKRVKSSLKQRPREEWIPLELPANLRLVHQDRWERVQAKLKQNISFSHRNEKHPYLLKGLIQCGACGSRYVGDAWHGRFYYRCSRRCKRLPAIREFRLEQLVVETIEKMKGTRHDLRSLPRAEQRDFLWAAISVVVLEESRIEIHSRPESGPTFPAL